jgi:hypothetical protein
MTNTTTAPTAAASTARTKPATSPLARSARFRAFVFSFSITAPLVYLICLFWRLPLFTFHPATYRLVWGFGQPISGEGPVMYWYGWTANVLIISTIVGIIGAMLPESMTKRLPLVLVWLLPVLAVPFFIYSLMPNWTHP